MTKDDAKMQRIRAMQKGLRQFEDNLPKETPAMELLSVYMARVLVLADGSIGRDAANAWLQNIAGEDNA